MAADPVTKNTVSDLLNYDISDNDDPFQDIDQTLRIRDEKVTLSPRAVKRKAANDKGNDILGLDEEVKITKKRKPIAKLDETRLLSQPGLPKLRALARSGQIGKKLTLKGRGHEFSDAAKLLNFYQLWLDDLYPRAKFEDALQLVEKAGHSKRMQTIRKEWIDEGKPGYGRWKENVEGDVHQTAEREKMDAPSGADTRPSEVNGEATARPVANQSAFSNAANTSDLFFPETTKKPDDDDDDDAVPEDDELDALLAEQDSSRVSRLMPAEPEAEGADDRDALLAEQESKALYPNATADRDAALDEEDDFDNLRAEHSTSNKRTVAGNAQEVGGDKDDLDALLAEHESRKLGGAGASAHSSSPFPVMNDDGGDSGLSS